MIFSSVKASTIGGFLRGSLCLIVLIAHGLVFTMLPLPLTAEYHASARQMQTDSRHHGAQTCNCGCRNRGDGICRCACCKNNVLCTCNLSTSDEKIIFAASVKDATLTDKEELSPLPFLGSGNWLEHLLLEYPYHGVPKPPPKL